MGLPLAAGHVLVRLGDGPQQAAEAVLDALEAAFPTHTGRGRTRIGNAWEDPATVTSEGTRVVAGAQPDGVSVRLSQSFDARDPRDPPEARESPATGSPDGPAHPIALAGGVGADLLGSPDDVRRVLGVLAGLCATEEESREEQGPQLAVRLRLGRLHG
ncbi:hypothetical protein [Kitasatospora sp. NPDC085464]|uniref:hypothetical protein n=1 Tax=Kitasatospora sp. NPDC085464 TaxID=3364063 RepID=UPI0037C64CAF